MRALSLPKTEQVKLTITIPIGLRDQLSKYAEVHAAAHHQTVEIGALAVQILQQFMARDRAFQKALRERQ